jgi:hypothetical protein
MFAERAGKLEGLAKPDGRGDGLVHQVIEGGQAEQFEHFGGLFRPGADVAANETVGVLQPIRPGTRRSD